MNILVLDTLSTATFNTFFPKDVQARLEQVGHVRYWKGTWNSDEMMSCVKDVDVIFTSWGAKAFNKEFYEAANKLKIIAHTGGSIADLVNEEMEKRDGLVLLSGNKYYAESVAQATICYMLLGQRKLYQTLKETERTGWWRPDYNAGLRGKTIGLLSFGMIAKDVARMLQVFDCKVKVYSSHTISEEERNKYHFEVCSIEELFRTCDIISIHSGLTEKTYHMVDEHLLSMMKEDALLVNTSRGAVIDEAALEKYAAAGKIRAVLDVFEVEPLPLDSRLRGLDNVVIVPHSGGPTIDVRQLVTMGLIDDIERYFIGNGQLENQISMSYAKNMTKHTITARRNEEKNT